MSEITYETPQFRTDFRRASSQAQKKIESFIEKFTEDTTRGGLKLKTPKGASDNRVKVARVDQGLRAVLVHVGAERYALVRVMEHDAAYNYSSTMKVDVSSFNGLPRLVEIPVASSAAPPLPVSEAAEDLFAHRRDRDFAHVGVPDFAVPALRALSDEAGVSALADMLGSADPLLGIAIHRLIDPSFTVDEIYRELLELDGGPAEDQPRTDGVWSGVADDIPVSAEAIDTDDLESALQRPGASPAGEWA